MENLLNIEAVAVDSGYDTSLVHRELDEDGIMIFTPKKNTGGTSKIKFERTDFSYDEAKDQFICPNGASLNLQRLQRNDSSVTREYRANTKDCKTCLYREKCLAPSQKCRRIQVNIFEGVVKQHHAQDGSAEYGDALRKRAIWSEGTFAAQKREHNLRQILRRGIETAETHSLLSATALNLKRMVKCMVCA